MAASSTILQSKTFLWEHWIITSEIKSTWVVWGVCVVRVWVAVFCFRFFIPLCQSERVNGSGFWISSHSFYFRSKISYFLNFSITSPFLQAGPKKEFENSKIPNGDREPSLITENAKLKYVQPPCCPLAVWTKERGEVKLHSTCSIENKVALQIVESPKCLLIKRSFIVRSEERRVGKECW